MNELEVRKRALAAEAEVYRETLKMELQNLRLYGWRAKEKLTALRKPNALLMLAVPLLGLLLRRRRSSWLRKAVLGGLSWQLARIVPLLAGLFSFRRTSRSCPPETRQTFEPLKEKR